MLPSFYVTGAAGELPILNDTYLAVQDSPQTEEGQTIPGTGSSSCESTVLITWFAIENYEDALKYYRS